jgi:hypothetical protein
VLLLLDIAALVIVISAWLAREPCRYRGQGQPDE